MTILPHESYPDPYHDVHSKTIFGFWLYLLTDFMLFAALFATYLVLHRSTFGGPTAQDLFHLPFTLLQTLVLLASSFVCGLAGAFAHRKRQATTIVLFGVTFLLGLVFLGMEFAEFTRLVQGGNTWQGSAFLSMYFTLVGTHAAHMIIALLWVIVLIIPVCIQGLTPVHIKRLTCLRMFWQFLNVVWIFIFTVVYLVGVN